MMNNSGSDYQDSTVPEGSTTPLDFDDWNGEINAKEMDAIKLADALSAAAASTSLAGIGGENTQKITTAPPITTEEKPSKKRSTFVGGAVAPTVSRRKKKPKGMPKRPLSAYNVFFQSERVLVLNEHNVATEDPGHNVSFEELGRTIGARWKALSEEEKKKYELMAQQDSVRYRKEMEVFNETKRRRAEAKIKAEAELAESRQSSSTSRVLSTPPDIKPPFFFPVQARLPGQPFDSSAAQPQEQQGFAGAARETFSTQGGFPIPPGTEVVLPDPSGRERNFKVQYKFYTMTRKAAETYMENLHRMQYGGNDDLQQQDAPAPSTSASSGYQQQYWG